MKEAAARELIGKTVWQSVGGYLAEHVVADVVIPKGRTEYRWADEVFNLKDTDGKQFSVQNLFENPKNAAGAAIDDIDNQIRFSEHAIKDEQATLEELRRLRKIAEQLL